MMLILPTAWLRTAGACSEEVRLVEQAFGTHIPLTPAVIEAAVGAGIAVAWLTGYLTEAAVAEYQAEFVRVRGAAYAEYKRVTDAALAGFFLQVQGCPPWAAASAEYKRVADAAWAEYQRITTPILARILLRRSSWRPEVLAEWSAMMA